jgi:hypothetical protein
MEMRVATRVIVVNERAIFVDPSTPITDERGRERHFRHLRPGRWVAVEAEPDEMLGIVATRIVLIRNR